MHEVVAVVGEILEWAHWSYVLQRDATFLSFNPGSWRRYSSILRAYKAPGCVRIQDKTALKDANRWGFVGGWDTAPPDVCAELRTPRHNALQPGHTEVRA